MNRFAQLLYGKVIYIYKTYLSKDQLSTVFSPNTFWIDVTGKECEVGYIVDFDKNVGLTFTKPLDAEKTLDELKKEKLEKVDIWTSNKITSGFTSTFMEPVVKFDSDLDTQITMQGIALNVNTARFSTEYPQGCPCRGYSEGATEKTIYYLTPSQVLSFCADLSAHVGESKKQGWVLQERVKAATTKEELDAIIL